MAKMIQIDGKKLDKLFSYKGLKKATVSRDMGYNDSFLNKCILRGQISMSAVKMLETMHGIMFEDYQYAEPLPPEPVPETTPEAECVAEQTSMEISPAPVQQVVPLNMEDLQKAVALAMDNMRTDYDALRGAIREGILDAIYSAINDSDTRNAISGLLTNAHLSALQLNLKKVKEAAKK